jgi:hypothetical protein
MKADQTSRHAKQPTIPSGTDVGRTHRSNGTPCRVAPVHRALPQADHPAAAGVPVVYPRRRTGMGIGERLQPLDMGERPDGIQPDESDVPTDQKVHDAPTSRPTTQRVRRTRRHRRAIGAPPTCPRVRPGRPARPRAELSRWRHGFESRWGCQPESPRSAVPADRDWRAAEHLVGGCRAQPAPNRPGASFRPALRS